MAELTVSQQIEQLAKYYSSTPSLKGHTINPEESMSRMHMALSGSEYNPEHLGITWPLLLGGVLQADLIKQYNSGQLTAADVKKQADAYFKEHTDLHPSFVDDVLRNIGYKVNIKDNTVDDVPERVDQGYYGDSQHYFDVNRG